MILQLLFRFLIGGVVVTAFAILADILKPSSFAGLFGAAPSVAIATLALTIFSDGKLYAAQEARSMIGGAVAFFVYASICVPLLMKKKWRAAPVTVFGLVIWLSCALAIWRLVLR